MSFLAYSEGDTYSHQYITPTVFLDWWPVILHTVRLSAQLLVHYTLCANRSPPNLCSVLSYGQFGHGTSDRDRLVAGAE